MGSLGRGGVLFVKIPVVEMRGWVEGTRGRISVPAMCTGQAEINKGLAERFMY